MLRSSDFQEAIFSQCSRSLCWFFLSPFWGFLSLPKSQTLVLLGILSVSFLITLLTLLVGAFHSCGFTYHPHADYSQSLLLSLTLQQRDRATPQPCLKPSSAHPTKTTMVLWINYKCHYVSHSPFYDSAPAYFTCPICLPPYSPLSLTKWLINPHMCLAVCLLVFCMC